MLTPEHLHDYQKRAATFVCNNLTCALWLSMGLGKTVTLLTAIVELFHCLEITRVLIIAPLRVALHVWPQEIPNWSHTRHLSYRVIRGTPRQRLFQTKMHDHIHIINRENLKWLVEVYGADWPYDMVVIDESSSFKSASSQRFKAMRTALPYVDRVVELTGTPISNGYLDIWAQMFLLDHGDRLGRTFTAFKKRFFHQLHGGFTWAPWVPNDGAVDQIQQLVSDKILRMAREDYLQFHEPIPNRIMVGLDNKQRDTYTRFERDFLLTLEESQEELLVLSAGALTQKLMQYCNGAVYGETGTSWVYDLKIEALESILEENPDENILEAYSFVSDRDRLLERFKFAVDIKEPGAIER